MSGTNIKIEMEESVAILKMARSPANAITFDMANEFLSAFQEIIASNPKAIVLTGTDKFFSGGLDLREVPTYSAERQKDFLGIVNRMILNLYSCSVPIIAAVNGHAVAAGFILALTADYRIGPKGKYSFGLTEARAGIPFPAAPMTVLKAELSPSDVRYSTLYAVNYGPDEAMSRGVFDELQKPDKVLERALEIARDFATTPADAYQKVKRQTRDAAIETLRQIVHDQSDPMMEGWISPDAAAASEEILKA